MLIGYIDDSKADDKVLILAGYIANDQQWTGFSYRWAEALTMKPPCPLFKMRQIDLSVPSQMKRAQYHYRIIEEFIPFGFCVAIPIPPLAKVTEELRIAPKFRNPYYLAWLVTISFFRNSYLYSGWTQPIDLVFDVQAESKLVLEAWKIMTEQNENMEPFKNPPIFRSDNDSMPLQAADLLAWWARKNWVEHGTFNNQKWLFPWEERDPGPDYLFQEINEDGIRKHFLKTIIPLKSLGV